MRLILLCSLFAVVPAFSAEEGECTDNKWMYNWMTDSYYKLGYNKTFEEAKAACIADGGHLASIHSQQENDFILVMAYIDTKKASVDHGIFLWIGVEPDGMGSFRNFDGTPFDYSYWEPYNPNGNGPCIRLYTGEGYYPAPSGLPGMWDDLPCSIASEGYVCRKSNQLLTCPGCEPITRGVGNWLAFPYNATMTVTYENTPNGCMVNVKCSATALGNFVSLEYEDGSGGAGMFHEVIIADRYKCESDGKWRDTGNSYYSTNPDWTIVPTKLVCVEDNPHPDCKHCEPVTQQPVEEEGYIDGNLTISYHTYGGCASATFTCTATAPNKKVLLFDGNREILFGEGCNSLTVEYAYKCYDDINWGVNVTKRVLPKVICAQFDPALDETCVEPPPPANCTEDHWEYYWMTNSYYKIGYNKTFDEAMNSCETDEGQLASIHSQEENDFIVLLARMKSLTAAMVQGISLWIGARSAPTAPYLHFNIDGTIANYSNWNPDQSTDNIADRCVQMSTAQIPVGEPAGQWSLPFCNEIAAYVCKKPGPPKCTLCPAVKQWDPENEESGNLTVWYENDETTGCLYASFTCRSITPNEEAHYLTGDGVWWLDQHCNEHTRPRLYTCNDDGIWILTGQGHLITDSQVRCIITEPCTP